MNKYNLKLLLRKIIETASPVEKFTEEELWRNIIFDGANEYLNDSLTFHEPSRFVENGRVQLLRDSQTIEGDYLLFDFIGHVPAWYIKRMNTIESLIAAIISRSGILNGFTTLQVPVVKGEPKNILAVLKYKSESFNNERDWDLFEAVKENIKEDAEKNMEKSREKLIDYKNSGGKQRQAYNTIMALYTVYNEVGLENETGKAADVLDIIAGEIRNKEWKVWEGHLGP
jgi:hypothetical protein